MRVTTCVPGFYTCSHRKKCLVLNFTILNPLPTPMALMPFFSTSPLQFPLIFPFQQQTPMP